jgi:hypothetical protein
MMSTLASVETRSISWEQASIPVLVFAEQKGWK